MVFKNFEVNICYILKPLHTFLSVLNDYFCIHVLGNKVMFRTCVLIVEYTLKLFLEREVHNTDKIQTCGFLDIFSTSIQ